MAPQSMGEDEVVGVNVMVSPGMRSPEAIRRTLDGPGVVQLEQTFPHESDDELKRLYVLKVRVPEVKKVISKLRRSADVEYAEIIPSRTLVSSER